MSFGSDDDRKFLDEAFPSGGGERAPMAAIRSSVVVVTSPTKSVLMTKIDISTSAALEVMKTYTTAAWESVKETSFGKHFSSLSALLAEASTTGAAGDGVTELEEWVAAVRRGKEFAKAYRDFVKARHKPERSQVGAPMVPFRKFLVGTLNLQPFPTMELLYYKVAFKDKMMDPKVGDCDITGLATHREPRLRGLGCKDQGDADFGGRRPLKISIDTWLRSCRW